MAHTSHGHGQEPPDVNVLAKLGYEPRDIARLVHKADKVDLRYILPRRSELNKSHCPFYPYSMILLKKAENQN